MMTSTTTATAKVVRITPADMQRHQARLDVSLPAVQELLALQPCALSERMLAERLNAILPGIPELRPYDEDDERTAAEDVVSAARRYVAEHASPRRDSTGYATHLGQIHQEFESNLYYCRESAALRRFGDHDGFCLRPFTNRVNGEVFVSIYRRHSDGDQYAQTSPLMALPGDLRRDQVTDILRHWRNGYDRGRVDGERTVKRRFRDLLDDRT